MKPWIKDTIKESKLGYLVYHSSEQLQTIPFPYIYRKGRLVSHFSVLLVDLLEDMQRSPSVVLVIHNDMVTVTLKVTIQVLVDTLQQVRQVNPTKTLTSFTPESDILESIDHFKKQVELILTPRAISAVSDEEEVNYELEIL